jgi:hypothetical protein
MEAKKDVSMQTWLRGDDLTGAGFNSRDCTRFISWVSRKRGRIRIHTGERGRASGIQKGCIFHVSGKGLLSEYPKGDIQRNKVRRKTNFIVAIQ